MLLLDLKNHLQNHASTSLIELSLKFKVEADVLRNMLGLLVRKGQVRICNNTPKCKTPCAQCTQCTTAANEIYEWVHSQA